jgi:hypothetical protein
MSALASAVSCIGRDPRCILAKLRSSSIRLRAAVISGDLDNRNLYGPQTAEGGPPTRATSPQYGANSTAGMVAVAAPSRHEETASEAASPPRRFSVLYCRMSP